MPVFPTATLPLAIDRLNASFFKPFLGALANMDAAHTIRDAVARVSSLRAIALNNPGLAASIATVKRFQAERFTRTYADILTAGPYQGAARFFVDELYSDRDYTLRDAQFSRIAGALQTFFPKNVVATAVALAELHALTEEIDQEMGQAWDMHDEQSELARYVAAWQKVGRPEDRHQQLAKVLAVGAELDRLTRMPGLRLTLRMMRRPAQAAGLSSLQGFLESGFDTFAKMSGRGSDARTFLNLIQTRETALMTALFSGDVDAVSVQIP